MSLISTGLVFLFWSFLCIGAVKFVIKMIIPRRIRKSFSKLWNFSLNLACTHIESYSKVMYKSYVKKLKERKASEEQSDDEIILPSLDAETIKYDNAVSGNKATVGEKVIYHNFKVKRSQSK